MRSSGSDKLSGDLLCVSGAVLYGVSNVCQEYIVCRHGNVEYLAMVGIFASLVSSVQLSVLRYVGSIDLNNTSDENSVRYTVIHVILGIIINFRYQIFA